MVLGFSGHPHKLHPCKWEREDPPEADSTWNRATLAGSNWTDGGVTLLGAQNLIQAARTVISLSYTLWMRNGKGPRSPNPVPTPCSIQRFSVLYPHPPKEVSKRMFVAALSTLAPNWKRSRWLRTVNEQANSATFIWDTREQWGWTNCCHTPQQGCIWQA